MGYLISNFIDGTYWISSTSVLVACLSLAGAWTAARHWTSPWKKPRYPTINREEWDLFRHRATQQYITEARTLIKRGLHKYRGPFTIITTGEPVLVLPPQYTKAVSEHPALSFGDYAQNDNLAFRTWTFSAAKSISVLPEPVLKGLSRKIPTLINTISSEVSDCLDEMWETTPDWHEIPIKQNIIPCIARLTSRIFLGPTISSNPEWIQTASDYTVDIFLALERVKRWPRPLYFLAEILEPACWKARAQYATAARILQPFLQNREESLAQDQAVPEDSIEWIRNFATRKLCSDVDNQLGLTITSVHTMADLLTQAIINLCVYPDIVPALRAETVRLVQKNADGMIDKSALNDADLLDSFLKETQRLKPFASAALFRRASCDVRLDDEVFLHKGQNVCVAHRMWDEERYEGAETFKYDRWVRCGGEAGEGLHKRLVATSEDFTAFGHGRHACPGRFFAAAGIKIALMQILLRYDLKPLEWEEGDLVEHGFSMTTNPAKKIFVRRRGGVGDV
ncbi:uncharacterized protein MYCFIDRAFT_44970 [Pseudocercospora fijiensis CIRAD86]|uniref:Cytochrome P450 monooxygenase n=1 Tax=Pseudocercospora fijiensis (strain CIRAD86) TaxID=383855 RepID=M2YID9_PSEFD|nr:uncharacterized protein MYCFIDRAFT_44970 [Pseudocercospora fijiensis CIRAD86]EME77540.1 hypothetical protein MYCFIDRAFT_44970 [Pseudocercospora fijiensis CIRAD86]